ncbi:MAG: hypothetical protein KatS3mg111_0964 [Pirellulaceae bacterium]|nr:MAG: hypothetical protein KatS3mg111_0964 [Pirellulaceae bacterium]
MAPRFLQLDEGSLEAVRTVVANVRDLAFVLRREDLRVVDANRAAIELIGWTRDELTSFSSWEDLLVDRQSVARWDQISSCLVADAPPATPTPPESGPIDALADVKAEVDAQLALHASGGTPVWITINSIYLTTDHLLVLARPAHIAEDGSEVVRQAMARFRSIVDSLSICLVLKDREGRRIYANPAYLELRNFQLRDIIGKTDFDLFPEDLAERFSADDRRILQTGEVIHKFEENVDGEGRRTWTEIIKGPLRDADGAISGIQILFWDATQRKHTELELERERYLSACAVGQHSRFHLFQRPGKPVCPRQSWNGQEVPTQRSPGDHWQDRRRHLHGRTCAASAGRRIADYGYRRTNDWHRRARNLARPPGHLVLDDEDAALRFDGTHRRYLWDLA